MEKLAETENSIHNLIRRRWSPRAFDSRPVELAKIRSLLEAARWAPSCRGEQPWSFIVARREIPEEFQQMLHCLVEQNQTWAQFASVLMISVAHTTYTQSGKPNVYAHHDVGLATENLLLQAFDLDLYAHPMAGFDKGKTRTEYAIPKEYEPLAAIAIGYPGDPEVLPEPLRNSERRPRIRKPLEEFVFSGAWTQVSPFIQNQRGS